MSSGVSRMYDAADEQHGNEQVRVLNEWVDELRDIQPNTQQMYDIMWLMDSYDKIVANRNLIDLIGWERREQPKRE